MRVAWAERDAWIGWIGDVDFLPVFEVGRELKDEGVFHERVFAAVEGKGELISVSDEGWKDAGGESGRVAAKRGFDQVADAVRVWVGEGLGICDAGETGEPEVVFAGVWRGRGGGNCGGVGAVGIEGDDSAVSGDAVDFEEGWWGVGGPFYS